MDIHAANTTRHNNQPTKKHRLKISTANLSNATDKTRPNTHAHPYPEFIENKITLKGKVKVELEPHQDN